MQIQCTANKPESHLACCLINQSARIKIVSDASLNARKRGAFHWIIATSQTELWHGSGTIPGIQRDNHSGRAEGFGLLAAMTFLEKYMIATQTIPPTNSKPIDGYCDNLGVIQQIAYLQDRRIPNPNDTVANDYDLAKEIFATIQRIPIPIEMHHVKGHQDDKQTIDELSHEAKLNIICDEKAREALQNYPENISPHPTLPASYPHLKIKKQTIVRQYKEYM